MNPSRNHIVFVQYGDYREAFQRFAAGGPENYAAQRYSIEFVGGLARSMDVTVIALPSKSHDDLLPNGVRSIGTGWTNNRKLWALFKTLEDLKPSHLIVSTPLMPVLMWGLFRCKRVLPNFADSFSSTSIRGRFFEGLLARILNLKKFEFITNHNFPASRNLVKIGVHSNKILPWDWPAHATPEMNMPKSAPDPSKEFTLFYVGSVLESKGVGDLIEAAAILRSRRVDVRVTIAGTGAIDEMRLRAARWGISEYVDFKGRVSNSDVLQYMRNHDAVVVPSRHTYPEGLPMAIYEGLCSRTPLLVSSHPMFVPVLGNQDGVLMFEEGNASSLADAIETLIRNPTKYLEVSKSSAEAWSAIQVPLKTGELITRWISGSPDDLLALQAFSLDQFDRKA
ncbi:glycosyl transferase family 1 [Rhodoferax lacus]|uniref:Glycosyl transferase family 1 n=2 Tax=Rhodoferax lacus TaxID=2184758 RepID=A0A3E1RFF4_9BURK|nr:glycosyl transferase family 1 [Rhodoferax lacus]